MMLELDARTVEELFGNQKEKWYNGPTKKNGR